MAEEAKKERKPIFRSAKGQVVPGSVVESEAHLEARIQQGPNPEYAVRVRAYKQERRDELKAAIESGDDILVRGQLLGSKRNDSIHVTVNSVNEPLVIRGKVTNVTHSAPEKNPFLNLFILREVVSKTDGKTYKFGMPINAFNENASQLANIKPGDFLTAEVRETVFKRGTAEEPAYIDGFEIIGTATIGEKDLSNEQNNGDTPDDIADQAYPDNNGYGPDDHIPF